MDGTFEWVIAIVAATLVVAVVAIVVLITVRRRRLRERFGPEYDRAVERAGGDRRRAESELKDRLARRRAVDLRPLSPTARDRYQRRWDETQAVFVDAPAVAIEHAQALVDELMAERGYPHDEEQGEPIDLVSVDHPQVVEHYREARRIHDGIGASPDTGAATEERRLALVHYRALFAELLSSDGEPETKPDSRTEPEPATDTDQDRNEESVT